MLEIKRPAIDAPVLGAYSRDRIKAGARNRAMRKGLVGVILLAAIAAGSAAEAATVLLFNKMADGSGKSVSDAVIVVDGDRIVSVGSGAAAVPAGATVIDLRKYTAIPGMIDAHTRASI